MKGSVAARPRLNLGCTTADVAQHRVAYSVIAVRGELINDLVGRSGQNDCLTTDIGTAAA